MLNGCLPTLLFANGKSKNVELCYKFRTCPVLQAKGIVLPTAAAYQEF